MWGSGIDYRSQFHLLLGRLKGNYYSQNCGRSDIWMAIYLAKQCEINFCFTEIFCLYVRLKVNTEGRHIFFLFYFPPFCLCAIDKMAKWITLFLLTTNKIQFKKKFKKKVDTFYQNLDLLRFLESCQSTAQCALVFTGLAPPEWFIQKEIKDKRSNVGGPSILWTGHFPTAVLKLNFTF